MQSYETLVTQVIMSSRQVLAAGDGTCRPAQVSRLWYYFLCWRGGNIASNWHSESHGQPAVDVRKGESPDTGCLICLVIALVSWLIPSITVLNLAISQRCLGERADVTFSKSIHSIWNV